MEVVADGVVGPERARAAPEADDPAAPRYVTTVRGVGFRFETG